MKLIPFQNHYPQMEEDVFLADGVRIVGRVTLKARASVWFNSVLRADVNEVIIGEESNIQDLCVGHEADDHPLIVGNQVTVGHSVTLHGCTIGDGALIGIGATVLNGVKIGEGAMIASQSLVPEGKEIPPRVLVRGVPGKIIRDLTEKEIMENRWLAEKYVRLARMYMGLPAKELKRES